MIVKMKEILLFTLSSSVEDTVHRLGELGVVEIKEINRPNGEILKRRLLETEHAAQAISILENHVKPKDDGVSRQKYISKDPKKLTNRILISVDFKTQCQVKLDELNQLMKWYETWGKHVNIKDFAYLRKKGIFIRLYLVEKSFLDALPDDHCIVSFKEQDGKIPIALFTRDDSEKLKTKEEELPPLSFKEVRRRIIRKKRQLIEVNRFLSDHSENIPLLHDYHNLLKDRLGIQEALEGMGDIHGKLKYLRGYLPKDSVEAFESTAKKYKWGYQISEPDKPEEVPVYIKNPKWISIINPVLKFIDIVPGYKEVDVSIYFLVAFALFFAMLVGDAGYGALFLLATIIFGKKLPSQMRFLIYVLSGATIIWGVLSGTYFGSETIAAIPFFNNLIIDDIASFGVDNISFMMHLSFLIGAIHLTIAHSIRFFQFINSIKALSEIGWIAFVWGLFFVAEKLVLGNDLPEWSSWLFIAGGLLVTLFSQEGKNFFNSILVSIANLPLNLINGFSDIVSYVRLFAVGMATATVAASFNNMILPSGLDISILELLIAAIALLLGHGLNIILALMAVMVHGIRLNMLEFAGHLGVQFLGEAYKPFKLNVTSKEIEEIKN